MILELCLWACWQHGSTEKPRENKPTFSYILANRKIALPTVLVHSEGLGEVSSFSIWNMSVNIN